MANTPSIHKQKVSLQLDNEVVVALDRKAVADKTSRNAVANYLQPPKKEQPMTITKEQLAATLESHAKWLRTRNSANKDGERANLTDAVLTDADLAGAVLAGANLAGANLAGAVLTDADLARADLTRADLTGADLTDADLTGADLRIQKASPFVYDAIAAVQSARVALQKTRIEWLNR